MSNIRGFHNLDIAPDTSNQSGARPSGAGYYPAAARSSSSSYASAVPISGPVSAVPRPTSGPGGSVVYGVADTGVNVSMMRAPPHPDDPQGDSLLYRFFPRWNKKSFTFVISCLQVTMFLISLIVGGAKCDGAFVSGNKMAGPSSATFYLMGAKWEPSIREGHIYRLLTPVLLHGGVIHILSNLFFQLRFGFSWEARFMMPRAIACYLIGAVGASFLSSVAGPRSISVGASGALMAMLGADLSYLAINWPLIQDRVYEAGMMVVLALLSFLWGLGSSVDNYAHLGGLLTGLVVAGWLFEHGTQPDRTPTTSKLIVWGSAVLSVAWALIMICMLWAGNPDPELNAYNSAVVESLLLACP